MEFIWAIAIESLKVVLLLTVAAGISAALRRNSARLRVVVWSTAIVGSLLIPMATPLLPSIAIPLPFELPGTDASREIVRPIQSAVTASVHGTVTHETFDHSSTMPAESPAWRTLEPTFIVSLAWTAIAGLVLSRLGFGLWRMRRTVRRSRQANDESWSKDLEYAKRQVGCRRHVRLVFSDELQVPATVGFVRPTVILPESADTWPRDRRDAVLLHELVHVARLDWPVRVIARIARGVYWFNPLAWWAVHRLDLEQELACDEEVVALGTRPSSYACHLLGIARAAARVPTPAIYSLEMARLSNLEERIMSILNNKKHRRVGLAVLIPAAVLMAAMVPALAAVAPSDSQNYSSRSEIKEILTEMNEAEARLQPHIDKIEAIEMELAPQIEFAEQLEVEIDHEAIAEIEERMKPYIARMEQVEIDMEPLKEQLEAIEREMKTMEFHIEDGTLEEIERQLHDQMGVFHEKMEAIHIDMEPFHDQLEMIHREMEPFHEEMAELHRNLEPLHEQMHQIHVDMEPFHEQMTELHREMEPFHEEMERLGERLENAVRNEIANELRQRMGAVTGPNAPFTEAADRIMESGHVHVNDDRVMVEASARETRQILRDLFSPLRIGSQENFDAAVEDAVNALTPLEIRAD